MKVAVLQDLVAGARRFAEAADISTTAAKKLAGICEVLEPFKEMDAAAFAELVRQAEEYRRTGQLPVSTKPQKGAAKKPKPTAEEVAAKIKHRIEELNKLYAIVHEETTGYGAIEEICDAISKEPAGDVKKIAAGFGIKLKSSASRIAALQEIKRKLTEQKGSVQRTAPIGTS